jgi:superfamily II DNA or RNA helicase/CHASE3 domain sensor protein
MSKVFRYYQEEANNTIYEELLVNNKCIVKMFCGTGKSLLMRRCKTIEGKNLIVFVFPSLSLIDQFYSDYLSDFPTENMLKISSENEATTNHNEIKKFLCKNTNKIICITYQSFKTLLDNLDEIQINVCIFDEAHHAVGETYQKLIFENNICEKQIFFTATPKNANGIIMYDREEMGMCGKLVYDYSYLRGMNDGFLNPFEIRIDMFSENINKSVYESIARAILSTGNNRVLTFHSDVNTERNTSVNNFVNDAEFKIVFKEVQKKEFPQIKKYKKVSMIGLTASVNGKQRRKLLDDFDTTEPNQVIVISSCETIGEGIDTKNANMCVFVDPKSSYVKIIQNIGRVVRKQQQVSTILIPCWVDKTKYLECNNDKDKCDEVIREDMSESGNFNGILNVLSALKQEDEDIYDICLYYTDSYSPQEIKNNLEKQKYIIEEHIGDGGLVETLEYLLDNEVDYEEYAHCETEEEMIKCIAEDNDICVEIHTNSLENPVERYNSECESGEVVRLYKSVDEELEDVIYQPIVKKEQKTKRNSDIISGPKIENRLNIKVHINPDIKVLWNITSDIDFTKEICSCVIDCEVVDNWYENFESVKLFINKNKRKPSKTDDKILNKWLSHQITNYNKKEHGMKDEAKYSLWSKFLEEYKEYFKSDDDAWYENFEKLKNFINENKRKPSQMDDKILNKWLSHQNTNYNKKERCMKDEAKYLLWSKFLEEYKEYFKSEDEVWYENFEELKNFINENKRKPFISSSNEIEKKLCIWLSHQITIYKKKLESMKDETRYSLWTKFLEEYKEYIKSNDEIWDEKFKELKKFINENKRRPSSGSSNEIEKKLASWISTQIQNHKKKLQAMKDETIYSLWSEFLEEYKEYFKSDNEVWYENFESVKQFINKNKRRPSMSASDEIEKKLGKWISSQTLNHKNKKDGMKDETKYSLWSEFLEEYKEYFKSDDEVWYEKFEELKTFINENKRRPSEISSNEIEKKLGSWLSHQITNYNKKLEAMKDEAKYLLWSKFLEEYKEYFKSNDEVWDENFKELKKFINENKRRPSHRSSNEIEKKLTLWINTQTQNHKKKLHSMKDETKYSLWSKFLEEYKEYFKSNDEVWYENFESVKLFINENKRRPYERSSNVIEKKLGSWISKQIQNHKKKLEAMKDETKYSLWSKFLEEYKEYFKSDDEVWYENFESVKLFIDENKRKPCISSSNEIEKKLGNWIHSQTQNHKKKLQAMKDETRYSLWSKFLEEYAKYFKNSVTQSVAVSDTQSVASVESETIEEKPSPITPKKKCMKIKKSLIKKETSEQKTQRIHSEISILHQRYKTLNSENLHTKFNEQPSLWDNYHRISEENEKSFPEHEIPRNRVITELNKIKTKRRKLVVDMGCGKGQISQYFLSDTRFKFINYDHISSNETIISCDISNIPLEDDSVEICILSLAMWGSNCKEYVKEANRILESGGKLYIIEPTKRWSEQDENGNIIPEKEGCKMKKLIEENGFKIVEQSIEKFCMFICVNV